MNTKTTLASFLDKLPSVISKQDTELTLESLESRIIQLKTAHNTYFKYTTHSSIKSKIGMEIEGRVMASTKNTTIGELIGLGIQSANKHFSELDKAIKEHLDEDNPRDTMSYNKLSIMKIIDLYGFWIDYSMSIMRYVSACEVSELSDSEPLYSKAFASKIEENLGNWLLFSDIIISNTNFAKVIDSTTDMVIVSKDKYSETGDVKKDQLRMGIIGTYFNIFYLINDIYAEIYAWYYDLLKSQKQQILMHIEYLESVSENGTNIQILKHIETDAEKLKKIEFRIKKMEEDTLS